MEKTKRVRKSVGFIFLFAVASCQGSTTTGGGPEMCMPGETVACYTGPEGTDGVGACHGGAKQCNADGLGFGACVGEQTPQNGACDAASPGCGDGVVAMGEECDDGNQDSTDSCTAMCKLPVCGDGFMQSATGESCDDGGKDDGDACSATCKEQKVLQVQAGSISTCALLSGGLVKCWGSNSSGKLGLGDDLNRGDGPNQMGGKLPAVDLGTGKTATAIAMGSFHACALLSDGSVKCWGGNSSGQLGLGDTLDRGGLLNQMGDKLPAVNLGTGKTATAIAAGEHRTCAILSDGSVKCWGANGDGSLGLGDMISHGDQPGEMGDSLPPINLGTGKKATALTMGHGHVCALLSDGSVKCWGDNAHGELGLGDTQLRGATPGQMGDNLPTVDLGAGKTATAFAAGLYHTCVILDDKSLKCWGGYFYGVLGAGEAAAMNHRGDSAGEMGNNMPVLDLGFGKTVRAIAASWYHTCAVLSDTTTKCWGNNSSGELGIGDAEIRGDVANELGDNLPPVDLGMGKTAVAISEGSNHSCALLNDSSIKCWGGNSAGTLGLGNTKDLGDGPGEMGDALPAVKLFSDAW